MKIKKKDILKTYGHLPLNLIKNNYQIPSFTERTPQGEKHWDPYSKLFDDRVVFLGLVLNDEVADAVMAQLLVLEAQEPNRDITIYIHSYGGSSTAMTAIYDTIQYISAPVQTICLGIAASAAAVLLASGKKGSRLALPNSTVMIHQPHIEQGYGQASDVEIQAKEIQRTKDWLINTLAKHTGNSISKVEKDIERDNYLSPNEALKYGIVDKVLSSRK